MTEGNHKLRPVGYINMVMHMEDVDSKSMLQSGLQGIDIDDPAYEKEGTMVTLERPGPPGEAHSSGCSYHKQTVSILFSFLLFKCVSYY